MLLLLLFSCVGDGEDLPSGLVVEVGAGVAVLSNEGVITAGALGVGSGTELPVADQAIAKQTAKKASSAKMNHSINLLRLVGSSSSAGSSSVSGPPGGMLLGGTLPGGILPGGTLGGRCAALAAPPAAIAPAPTAPAARPRRGETEGGKASWASIGGIAWVAAGIARVAGAA